MNWLAALGWPGALSWVAYLAVTKTTLFNRDDPSRNDVLNEIRGMRRDNEGEFRSLRDRMTKVETILDERKP